MASLAKTKNIFAKKIGTVATAAVFVGMCANLLSCDLNREHQTYRNLIVSEETAGGLAIMQGVTTEHQTQIFVLTETSSDHIFSLLDEKGREILPATVDFNKLPHGSGHTMHKLLFQELTPNTMYLFQARSPATEELVDERELQTLSSSRQDLRFAFTSCMLDYYNQEDIWQQMVALDPDVIFLIGDNVYADVLKDMATPSDLWIRNIETRDRINLFRSKRLIPVVATWDDHDYGMNNAGRDYPYKEESLVVFKTFFASDQSENFNMPGIGVASSFTLYGYDFFLLDDRTFRTPIGESPEWHFGNEQSQWLWSNLQGKSHAFLISGDQFFGGYSPKDSFQGHHPERFSDFLDKLQASDTRVVFLSGDRHFTEIMKIPHEMLGYQTYEFTASPVHTIPKPFIFPKPFTNSGQ